MKIPLIPKLTSGTNHGPEYDLKFPSKRYFFSVLGLWCVNVNHPFIHTLGILWCEEIVAIFGLFKGLLLIHVMAGELLLRNFQMSFKVSSHANVCTENSRCFLRSSTKTYVTVELFLWINLQNHWQKHILHAKVVICSDAVFLCLHDSKTYWRLLLIKSV